MKKILSFLSVTLMLVFLSGCGYATRTILPGNFKTIYVEQFKNKILYGTESNRNVYFPLLEVKITNAIRDRYLFDGSLKIGHQETADLLLKGELLNYERNPLRYFENTQDVQEYRLTITVSLELSDAAQGKVLWTEPSFSGETTYFTSGTFAKTESAAIEDAFVDLARRVVERTIENW